MRDLATDTLPDCGTCHNTGRLLCDHQDTERDEDGWCNRCSTPGDIEIDGLVWILCDCDG
jgi:hypothetical protein